MLQIDLVDILSILVNDSCGRNGRAQGKKGLWAKAYAQCEGDPNRTKALYIKLRVQELKDDAALRAQQEHPRPPAVQVENDKQSASVADDWQDQSKTFPGGDTHPWRRFFARVVDYSTLGLLLFVLFCFVFYAAIPEQAAGFEKVLQNQIAVAIILCLLWMPVEAFFLSAFGATPAKWLFGIRVAHPDGTLLSFSEAFERSLRVFVQGLGFSISFIALFTQLFAYRRLTKTGTTRWDAAANAVVSHKEWGVFRALVCTVSVFFAMGFPPVLGSLLGQMYFQESAQQNYEQSQFQSKQDATQDSAQINTRTDVRQLFEKARRGDAQAQQALAQAAAQGDADAQFHLGVMYYLGQGVPQDYAQARYWYEKAAAQGFAVAQTALGAMYSLGQGVPQDYAQALRWFEKAAAQGFAGAQFGLGAMYYLGQGVRQDYAQGRQWVEKAAAQGLAEAQCNLGLMYLEGQGVRQDYAQARQWFEKAAAQGFAMAQFNLGLLYANGQGVRRDYAQARQWYEKAAAQGDAEAQYNLGVLYHNGDGVRQNKRTAKEWFGKACDAGMQKGCDVYRKLNEAGF